MHIDLQNAECENDFIKMLEIESHITKASGLKRWPLHIGGLIFDRFLYGNGAEDLFRYGKLIAIDKKMIGYALCYFDESTYVVRLTPEYEIYYPQVVTEIETLFYGESCSIIANTNDESLIHALKNYQNITEERFQAVIDLSAYIKQDIVWEHETVHLLTEQNIADRVTYGHIPTHEQITERMYRDLMKSLYYRYTLDYVIVEKDSWLFAGFVTWWIDENSNTALLEPVACLPEFRRRGIMKRALLHGLNELKDRGIAIAYVSTSIHNTASQPLYLSVGFQKTGTANRYTKILK